MEKNQKKNKKKQKRIENCKQKHITNLFKSKRNTEKFDASELSLAYYINNNHNTTTTTIQQIQIHNTIL